MRITRRGRSPLLARAYTLVGCKPNNLANSGIVTVALIDSDSLHNGHKLNELVTIADFLLLPICHRLFSVGASLMDLTGCGRQITEKAFQAFTLVVGYFAFFESDVIHMLVPSRPMNIFALRVVAGEAPLVLEFVCSRVLSFYATVRAKEGFHPVRLSAVRIAIVAV